MTTPRKDTIGFIGLGDMGAPMSANILKAGRPLVVFDLVAAKNAQAAALGARIATGPADVMRQAATVITMVDTTAQAEEVITSPGGLIDTMQAGDLVISMSTIDPIALRRMHEKLGAKGVDFIDAPVSGMDSGAKNGTLKCFAGGHAAAVDRARPILSTMCATVTHLGAIGQGCAMKLINNMLAQINRIVVAEALVLGTKAGLDPKQMFELLSNATGNSAALQIYGPRMLAHDFKGSRMDITFKDMELQTSLGKQLKVPMFMGNIAQQVCQMGRAAGYGSEDGCAIVKVYEQMAGVSVERR